MSARGEEAQAGSPVAGFRHTGRDKTALLSGIWVSSYGTQRDRGRRPVAVGLRSKLGAIDRAIGYYSGLR